MWLHDSQHTKNIELCTLNGPVFWYVNYTSTKLLFKNALAEKWNRGGKRDRRALKQQRERAAFEGHSSTATGINRPDLQSRLSLQLAVWPGKGPSRLCAFSLKHKMIQNKGVELDDLGSLSHLNVYSWPPAWGWGRRGEGKPEIGGLQRSWRASPSSLALLCTLSWPWTWGLCSASPTLEVPSCRGEYEGGVGPESGGGPDRSHTCRYYPIFYSKL